ncbi:MAG: response regulator [Elusimicrobiota bacterium]
MGKILVADDELSITDALKIILESEDFEVIVCRNGKEVLKKAKEADIDLIILDIMMPELSGYQVCSILKSEPATQFIPIIFLTALSQLDDKIKGLQHKADDFLTKPFNQLELLTRVKSLLRIRKLNDYLQESLRKLKKAEDTNKSLCQFLGDELKSSLTASNNGLNLLQQKLSGKISQEETVILNKVETETQHILEQLENIAASYQLEDYE